MYPLLGEQNIFTTIGDDAIGTVALNNTTNLLTLSYTEKWQQSGFAISPHLFINQQHTPDVAYNYLDNALPEGEARKLLAGTLGVSEKTSIRKFAP